MRCFVSWEVSTKANKWLGQDRVRWQYSKFDARFRAAEVVSIQSGAPATPSE
jgi:hypothetical protein